MSNARRGGAVDSKCFLFGNVFRRSDRWKNGGHDPIDSVPNSKRRRSLMRRREGRVLFIQYAHPGSYPPVLNASRILQVSGWSVSMLGIRMPAQAGFDVPADSARSVELVRAPAARFLLRFFFGWFCWRVRRSIRCFRPDWLYVSRTLSPTAC